MDVSPWVVMATALVVLTYLSIPVILVLVYLSRVNAAQKKAGKGSRGPDTDQTGGPAA